MARELSSTPEIINYTVAIFIVVIGLAPILWSPLSGFYGRRPVYLASMPITVVASIGVANSKSVGQLIGTRVLQGFGKWGMVLDEEGAEVVVAVDTMENLKGS
jgi:MFS family permease